MEFLKSFVPKIPLEVNMVKDTAWENAMQDIALIALPTLVPIPFGTYVESTIFDDAFMEEMNKILAEHGFWAKTMSDVFEQTLLNEDSVTIAERLMSSKTSSKARNPTRAATKGIRGATVASLGTFIETSHAEKKHETEQAIVRSFFRCNPTPVRIEVIGDDNEPPEVTININSASVPANENPATVQTNPVPETLPTILPGEVPAIPGGVPPEFYTQLIETMKIMQVVQVHQAIPKIVVESGDHEESVDLAKLQFSMLQLMYAGGDIDWEEGTVKNVQLADFVQGFKNHGRSAAVQAAQLTNLFMTLFTTEMDNNNDVLANPLQRLMSLICFPPKFMKGHLNASFQSFDLEAGAIYKSTSLNPFQCALQNNRVLMKAATSKMEEARNKINWKIVDKDRKQISLIIKGVGRVNSMEDVAMTCANICSVQLAIIDVLTTKPLLYQFALKMIKFIENKKFELGCATIWMLLHICQRFSWQKSIRFFSSSLLSCRIRLTPTKSNWD
jgi:hypothetical protein